MEVYPAPTTVTSPVKKNRTKSPAPARSWTLFSRSAGERGFVLASQVAEAVTLQSEVGVEFYFRFYHLRLCADSGRWSRHCPLELETRVPEDFTITESLLLLESAYYRFHI